MDQTLCLTCRKQVIPLVDGNCPGCGKGLVAPKPGYAPPPEREITYSKLKRTNDSKDAAIFNIVLGGIAIAIGGAVTWASYNAAVSNGGGWYIIGVGPLVFGLWRLLKGIAGLFTNEVDQTDL
jgi:hypothetical protein